jgi:hypothetical protein
LTVGVARVAALLIALKAAGRIAVRGPALVTAEVVSSAIIRTVPALESAGPSHRTKDVNNRVSNLVRRGNFGNDHRKYIVDHCLVHAV